MKTPVKTEVKTKFRMKLFMGTYSNNIELHETAYYDRATLGICDRWTRTITKGMKLKNGSVVDVSITVRKVKAPTKRKTANSQPVVKHTT